MRSDQDIPVGDLARARAKIAILACISFWVSDVVCVAEEVGPREGRQLVRECDGSGGAISAPRGQGIGELMNGRWG